MLFHHWVFILFASPFPIGVTSYAVDANLNLTRLNFQYRVARVDTTEFPGATHNILHLKDKKTPDKRIGRHSNSPKIIDIVLSNDNKLEIHDAYLFDEKATENNPRTHIATGTYKDYDYRMKPTEAIFSFESEESAAGSPETNRQRETERDMSGVRSIPNTDNDDEASLSIPSEGSEASAPQKPKKLRSKAKGKRTESVGTEKHSKNINVIKTGGIELYVKKRKVKDDPKIKEFTQHVYEQTIRVFERIKGKMTDYPTKKVIDTLVRSYEQKFGDFLRETQNQMIKTRLGGKKVILNIADTSNRIMGRLVNHLINEMDEKGILRNGPAESVILNEVNKKVELENKQICSELQICRSKDGFSTFISDLLGTILNSDDDKVMQFKDAFTEVMKNTDVSRIFDAATEKRYHKSIAILEAYDIDAVRPLLFVLRNLVTSKNMPINVIGPVDSRVNKTMSYLEVLDTWETKIPTDEGNLRVWNDMRNSLKDWSAGKRTDIADLVQGFVDHVIKAVSKFSREEALTVAKHFGTILGP